MASTPFKADATVFGVHLFTQAKNLFSNEEALNMIASGGFRGLAGFNKLNVSRTTVYANLQGPSFLLRVKPKVAIAFSWNMRFLWTSRFSQPQLAKLFDDDSPILDLTGDGETALALFNCWNEFGAGAAGEVWRKEKHSLAVGGFVKMVFGSGNMNLNLDNIEVETNGDMIEHLNFRMKALMSEQTYDIVDEGKLKLFDRIGFGIDLGAEYQLKNSSPAENSPYRFKAGFSLTDIGQTRYKSALNYTNVEVSGENISLERFRGASTLRGAVDTLREIFDIDTSTTVDYNVTLPMSFRLYGDYNFKKHLSVYTEFHFLFIGMMNPGPEGKLFFRYNVTPRFENKSFGVYLPLTFTNHLPANAGIALRWKPFIIGSSNLFTFWAYDERGKSIDLFLTVKIPILPKAERTMGNKEKKQKS